MCLHNYFEDFFSFDLIPYLPVNNISVMSGRSSCVEPVLSKDEARTRNPSISRQALYPEPLHSQ